MVRPKSQTLFHFTGKLEYLKGILQHGFHPRYCLEDLNWLVDQKVAYPMVCFCDIPLGRVDQHVANYGNYGIGMSRAWAVRKKLSPVIYLSKDSDLALSFNRLFNFLADADPDTKTDAKSFLEIMRYIKPLTGAMNLKGVLTHDVDFYQESEWRYVPVDEKIENGILEEEWKEAGVPEASNELTRAHCLLDFKADDIRYLFVEKDSDIPDMVDFINSSASNLGARFTGAEMKILQTRIVSQESLAQDL